MSASVVEDETKSLTAEGPVISVSRSNGGERNVTPSPVASNSMRPSTVMAVQLRFRSVKFR
jgi:hypothetical protein